MQVARLEARIVELERSQIDVEYVERLEEQVHAISAENNAAESSASEWEFKYVEAKAKLQQKNGVWLVVTVCG